MNSSDLLSILPLAVLAGWTCLLLLVDLFIPPGRKGWTAGLAALGLAVVLALILLQPAMTAGQPTTAFSGFFIRDGFSMLLDALIAIAGLIGIALAFDYLRRMGIEQGEYYVLLLFTILGTMQAFVVIIALVGGEFAGHTSVPVLRILASMRGSSRFGYACAQGITFGMILVAISFIQYKLSQRFKQA
jgi:NADH:ubiquinone oxidoreductase subunit 2 (subunit N)